MDIGGLRALVAPTGFERCAVFLGGHWAVIVASLVVLGGPDSFRLHRWLLEVCDVQSDALYLGIVKLLYDQSIFEDEAGSCNLSDDGAATS